MGLVGGSGGGLDLGCRRAGPRYFPIGIRILIEEGVTWSVVFEAVDDLVPHLRRPGGCLRILRPVFFDVVYFAGAVLTLQVTFFDCLEFCPAFSAFDGTGLVDRVVHDLWSEIIIHRK